MKTTYIVLMSALYLPTIHAYTLPQQSVRSYECNECSTLSRDALHDSWSIAPQSLQDTASNKQRSYGYREQVTAGQLQKGVIISTHAPGAVVRITPLQKKTVPPLLIKAPKEQFVSLKEASTLFSQDESSGDTFFGARQQTMLQIKPELGAGHFILKSRSVNEKYSNLYVINVFDKFSLTYLQVESDALHYRYGDQLRATITLKEDDIDFSEEDVHALLAGPHGQSIPLKLKKIKRNQFEAILMLDSERSDKGENWYIEANVEINTGDHIIKRTGHAAFSYAIPSASLINIKKISSKPLTFVATLDIATASRYALQSVLFHKNGDGAALKPIETTQVAQWFEPGTHTLQFTFDNSSQLSDDTLYLGYLHVLDYGQIKNVYQYNNPIRLTQLLE